jgi:hypothetical protein
MKLLALRASERCLWNLYEKLAQVNTPGANALGVEWEKIMHIWWFNTMTPEMQVDLMRVGLKPGL